MQTKYFVLYNAYGCELGTFELDEVSRVVADMEAGDKLVARESEDE